MPRQDLLHCLPGKAHVENKTREVAYAWVFKNIVRIVRKEVFLPGDLYDMRLPWIADETEVIQRDKGIFPRRKDWKNGCDSVFAIDVIITKDGCKFPARMLETLCLVAGVAKVFRIPKVAQARVTAQKFPDYFACMIGRGVVDNDHLHRTHDPRSAAGRCSGSVAKAWPGCKWGSLWIEARSQWIQKLIGSSFTVLFCHTRMAQQGEIGFDQFAKEVFEPVLRPPSKDAGDLPRVANQLPRVGRALKRRIGDEIFLPRQANDRECRLHEIKHAVTFPRRHEVIVRCRVIEHHPHRADIIGSVAPVPPGIDAAELELIGEAELDLRDATADFARDEILAPVRRLVVVEDAVADEKAVRLPYLRDLRGKSLRASVWANGAVGTLFGLLTASVSDEFAKRDST